MTTQWQPRTSGQPAHYASSTQSPLTVRKLLQHDDVPTGTVASRVQHLQNLANPLFARTPSVAVRRRENSRTGFGRRLTSRFAEPASRNHNPDEQTQVETAHSFLGLTTPRSNHEEEHAMARPRMQLDRMPGIHGQIKPQGISQRVQYDALSPWPVLSKPEYAQNTQQIGTLGEDLDALKETNRSRNDSHSTAQFSSPKQAEPSFQSSFDPYRRLKSHENGTIGSEASIKTTSTIRRQSVRDLFRDYGIERPARLVSSENNSQGVDGNSLPARPHRHCHVCSWITDQTSNKCWRCGHRHCAECDALSPIVESRRESHLESGPNKSRKETRPIAEPRPKENRYASRQPKSSMARPGPTPIQELPTKTLPMRKQSSPPIKFPSFDAKASTMRQTPRKSLPQQIAPYEEPRVVNMLSGTRVTTSVKESPFLIADMMSSGQPLRFVPVAVPMHSHVGHTSSRRSHRSRRHHNFRSRSSSPCSVDEQPRDPWYHEHNRHRHSRKHTPKRRHIHEETDHGYVADTSRAEDIIQPHSHHSHGYAHGHHDSRPQSRLKPKTPRPKSCSPCVPKVEIHSEDLVECHGYPRTGHHRQGSPTSTGIIGECQHCLNDCQCSACQNTDHSVRCCVHESHRSILHHHNTPRKENIANPMEFTTPPPKPPTPPGNSDSPARPVSTLLPPASQWEETIRPKSEELPKPQTLSPLTTGPIVYKTPSLPRSKKATLLNQESKVPTPTPLPQKFGKITGASSQGEVSRPQSLHGSKEEGSRRDMSHSKTSANSQNLPPAQNLEVQSELANILKTSSPKPSINEERSSKRESRGGTPPVEHISQTASRRSSRQLSALFQLRERDSIPLLNRKLTAHQEELKRIEKLRDEKIEAVTRVRVDPVQNIQSERIPPNTKIIEDERPTSEASSKPGSVRKGKWRMKLLDKQPSPICCSNDSIKTVNSIKEHRLSEDEMVPSSKTNGSAECRTVAKEVEEMHECLWKRMFLDEQYESKEREDREQDGGVHGITVLLHFEGREDFVFKGEMSGGGQLRIVGSR